MPADSTRLAMPLDSLLALPQGAVYEAANGRAHAKAYVARQGDGPQVVYVDAWCDSLARLVAWYESREQTSGGTARAETTDAQNAVRTEKEHPPNAAKKAIFLFIAGIAAGAVTTILIQRKRQ